jgi:hypothetical protein
MMVLRVLVKMERLSDTILAMFPARDWIRVCACSEAASLRKHAVVR